MVTDDFYLIAGSLCPATPPNILNGSAAPDCKETSYSWGRSNLLGDVQKNCRKCRGYNKEEEGSM